MPDIVDEIDRLHAKATKGPVRRCEGSGSIESVDGVFIASGTWPDEGDLYVALRNHWPAIRDRLLRAERERDEWKLASSKNGDAMSGYQSRAIVAEQQLEGAKRERDAALASLAERQRAIDEAFATLDAGHGMLACREAAHILLPHATKANHSETPKSSPRPQCPPNATIKQGEPPFRNAVFGPGCSPHPLDANPVGSEGTPQVSPVGNDDTRELVARLAEAIARYFDDGEETVINLINRVRDIENAARRGGGA